MEEWENLGNEIKDKDILSLQVKFWAYLRVIHTWKQTENKRENIW